MPVCGGKYANDQLRVGENMKISRKVWEIFIDVYTLASRLL